MHRAKGYKIFHLWTRTQVWNRCKYDIVLDSNYKKNEESTTRTSINATELNSVHKCR